MKILSSNFIKVLLIKKNNFYRGMRREPPAPDIHETLTQQIQQLSEAEAQFKGQSSANALSQQRHLEKIIEQLKEENR